MPDNGMMVTIAGIEFLTLHTNGNYFIGRTIPNNGICLLTLVDLGNPKTTSVWLHGILSRERSYYFGLLRTISRRSDLRVTFRSLIKHPGSLGYNPCLGLHKVT